MKVTEPIPFAHDLQKSSEEKNWTSVTYLNRVAALVAARGCAAKFCS